MRSSLLPEAQAAAGASRYTQYDFFEWWMMKRIAAKEGGDTDASRDTGYTDWAAVERLVDDLLRRARRSRENAA